MIYDGGKFFFLVCSDVQISILFAIQTLHRLPMVVTDLQKLSKTKGMEVPAIFVVTGEKTNLMINIKREIEKEIIKKQKRRKCLKTEDGDITLSMEFPKIFDDENQSDFSIIGLTIRGFKYYKKEWVPEKGDRYHISLNEGVVRLCKDGLTIGTVPCDDQKHFRKFIKAGGTITAVIAGGQENHRTKGEEVPAIYVFTGEWTNVLKNIRNEIIEDIKKRGKKKKSLKIEPGDVTEIKNVSTSKSKSEEISGAAGENAVNSDGAGDEMLRPMAKDGAGERTEAKIANNQIKGTRKRRSDESTDTVKKKSSVEMMQTTTGICTPSVTPTEQFENDDKIVLSEKDLGQISHNIGRNWILLGIQLGITNAKIDQIELNYPKNTATQIFYMLKEWSNKCGKEATLFTLKQAMSHCPSVRFEEELNQIFSSIRKDHEKSKNTEQQD